MTIWSTGDLYVNQPITEAVIKEIELIFDESASHFDCDPGDMYLSFDDEWYSDIDDRIRELIDVTKPLGYIWNGRIDYYGDYEGSIYVDNNNMEIYGVETRWQRDATDSEIIEVAKKRGYYVFSPDTLENVVAGANVAGYLEFGEEIVVDSDAGLADFILKKYYEWMSMDTDDIFMTFIADELRKEFGTEGS